jgi:predicted nucleic acid-binding protein
VIVLDTNVISELMRTEPNPAVFAWASMQPRSMLFTTSVNKAEIFYGVVALPMGRRRSALFELAEAMFADDFLDRVLPFDAAAAVRYASIVTSRQQVGRPIEPFDAQIAATALVFGAEIATRDVGGFADCGLTVINPWTAG